jgi:5-formyltetrahydrofolate cyclo-ligase
VKNDTDSGPGAEGTKENLRARARMARAAVSADARSVAAAAVAERALAVPEVTGARTVLAYAASAEELDPAPLVSALRARGARVAYPRVCGPGALALHWCDDEAGLAPGYCGIAEPAAGSPEALTADFDLVLVPGTAFDESCGRLGMGGGFYDRLLTTLAPRALAVGLAFDEQVVAEVPTEVHDVALGLVITPTRTILGSGRSRTAADGS